MSSYRAPLSEIRFVLFDVLAAESLVFAARLHLMPRAMSSTRCSRKARRFAETVLAPLNQVGDDSGCRFDRASGAVSTPPGFREAYAQYAEGGWAGLVAPPEFGGQGLPHVAGVPLKEMFDAANLAWSNFPLLSHGATGRRCCTMANAGSRTRSCARSSKAGGRARCA
jgi:alkylation response protein AidB-like acyl-CoA dehydrogenase